MTLNVFGAFQLWKFYNLIKMKITKVYSNGRPKSCNFCDRGVLSESGVKLIYPYDYVYLIENDSNISRLSVYICKDCLEKLKIETNEDN